MLLSALKIRNREPENDYLNRFQSWHRSSSGARLFPKIGAIMKKHHLQVPMDLNSIAQVRKRILAKFVPFGEDSPASTVPRSQAI